MVNTSTSSNNSKLPHRHLDFDDLSILTLMGEGVLKTNISIYLYLTPPAISHRLRKYEMIWPNIFKKEHNARILTEEGFDVCRKAKATVYSLLDLKPTDSYKELVEREIKTFDRFGKPIKKP